MANPMPRLPPVINAALPSNAPSRRIPSLRSARQARRAEWAACHGLANSRGGPRLGVGTVGGACRAWRCRVEAVGVPPGRDRTVGAEVLHESVRTRVSRLFLAGRTVIRKEPLGPDAQRRLRHELAVLERLRGVAGVAQVLDEPRYPGSIIVEDVGGTSLAMLAKPLAMDELITLAVRLAEAVAGMHRRGVMHRDISPANIVFRPTAVRAWSASAWRRRSPRFVPNSPITPRSSGPWRTWRRSRPGGPGGRWISVPTSTRWARRCMNWPPARRRSVPGTR